MLLTFKQIDLGCIGFTIEVPSVSWTKKQKEAEEVKRQKGILQNKFFRDKWSLIKAGTLNPLSDNPTKWSNTLKQFVGKLPTNCLSVFDHFVKLALKGLSKLITVKRKRSFQPGGKGRQVAKCSVVTKAGVMKR